MGMCGVRVLRESMPSGCPPWSKRKIEDGAGLLAKVRRTDGHQTEFIQAVEEVLGTLEPVFKKHPEYVEIMERLLEPERMVLFRVPWVDKDGVQQVNRGMRA